MARTNKYTSVNFNEIYEKKFSNNPSAKPNNPNNSSSSLPNNGKTKTIISNSRIQGNMLVLTRPSPKPISIPIPTPTPQQTQDSKDKEKQQSLKLSSSNPKIEENISLRPKGRTGAGPAFASPSVPVSPLISPSGSGLKSNKFVPPHLRPGFVGREERPVGPGGIFGHGENGRPKSGGGYERMMGHGVEINNYRAGVDPGYSGNRYASRGTRPNSSG